VIDAVETDGDEVSGRRDRCPQLDGVELDGRRRIDGAIQCLAAVGEAGPELRQRARQLRRERRDVGERVARRDE